MTRDEKITNNLPLVTFAIKKLGLTYMFDDVFDVGVIGLIKAVDSFNEDRKIKFSTYGYFCIRNEILMSIRKNKIQVLSLETPAKDNLTLMDTIKDDLDVEGDIVTKTLLEEIREKIDILSEKERICLVSYYGIFGNEKQNMMDIASKLKISQSYVSRIVQRSIKKLREVILK